jgi:hypothetical protein
MLANGMWVMSVPTDAVVFVPMTAGAEFCPITEHDQGIEFWVQGSQDMETQKMEFFFNLLLTPAQSERI